MILFNEFIAGRENFSKLKNKFEKLCKKYGCDFEILSKDAKGNDIFAIRTPDTGGSKVVIIAGLHGDEPGGPQGILDFFERKNLGVLKKNLLLIPVMNPDGYINFDREDEDDKDLNRQWNKDKVKPAIRTVKQVVIDYKPDFMLSLHEDPNADGFYLYPSKNADKDSVDYIQKFLHSNLQPVSKKTVYGDRVKKGIITKTSNTPKHYASMEKYFEKRGIPNVTLELPTDLPIEQRKKIYGDLLVNFVNWMRPMSNKLVNHEAR
jgi:predicted deacylase